MGKKAICKFGLLKEVLIMGNNDQDSGNGPGKGQNKGAGPRKGKAKEKG